MLSEHAGQRDPRLMATALRALPNQARPSEVYIPGLLDGLDVIRGRFADALDKARIARPIHQAAE
jgi:hypothetical protein